MVKNGQVMEFLRIAPYLWQRIAYFAYSRLARSTHSLGRVERNLHFSLRHVCVQQVFTQAFIENKHSASGLNQSRPAATAQHLLPKIAFKSLHEECKH